jgi:hypothetical protein
MKSQPSAEANGTCIPNDTKYYAHTTLSGTPGGGSERFLGGGD